MGYVSYYGHAITYMGRGGGVQGEEENAVDICFGSYNIRNGSNGGIDLALLAMAQENMDLGVLYEMKIIGRFYTCFLSDYNMLVLETPSNHQRGIALLLRESPHW